MHGGFVAIFKILVKYKNHSDRILEIEADSPEAARRMCVKIKEENTANIIRAKAHNIYISNEIEECVLYKLDWRDEFITCMNMEKKD